MKLYTKVNEKSIVLPGIRDTVKVFFGDKNEKEMEKNYISNNTVTRRIDEMSQ